MINNRLPAWFRQGIISLEALRMLKLLFEFKVNTVCQEAKCPNLNNCFRNLKVTFMILGNICTRGCRFCAVKKSSYGIKNINLDESLAVAQIIRKLGLKYVVITSVTRDDLKDGGAAILARTIELISNVNKDIKIEVLIPDFGGDFSSIKVVIDASPNVLAHNIETVEVLYKELRPQANYKRSLNILRMIKEDNADSITKSSIMLGMGETEKEVVQTMEDLRRSKCDILTLGQYLAPSDANYPVKEFISMEQFVKYREIARNLGFRTVLSGPLVRSSYRAEEVYQEFTYV